MMADKKDRRRNEVMDDDNDDDYDSVDGCHPGHTQAKYSRDCATEPSGVKPTPHRDVKDGKTNTGDDNDYDTVDHCLESMPSVDVSDGRIGTAKIRDTHHSEDYSDEDDDEEMEEQPVATGGCTCGGDGSCVANLVRNGRTSERPDSFLRTETVNKTGNELIQKHTMVGNRPVYTHSPKDLFSLINRNQGNLAIVWLKEKAPLTFLHSAVISRRSEILPILVDSGLFLDLYDCPVRDPHSDFTGYTAVEIAELQKNESIVSLLRQLKTFAESLGWIHACARDGNLDAVEMLLRRHPNLLHQATSPISTSSTATVQLHTGTEPIFWAVTSGSSKLVKFLLEKGADVYSTSSEGETLLTRAVALGQLELVRLLVATYSMDTNEPGYEQKTPIQRAVANKDVAMVKLLMDLGAQIPDCLMNDVAKSGHVQMFSYLRSVIHNLDIQDESGKFPLYYAILNDNLQMADELIKAGAKLTLRDRQQRSLLHLVVNRKNQETFDFVLKHLKQKKNNKKKAVLSELINQQDRYVGGERCFLVRGKDNGTAAFHYVSVNRVHFSLFRKMTRAGGSIDVVKYGSVILSGWGANPGPDVIETIEKRYDITKVTDRTELDLTPLNLAILKENDKMALALIEAGADVNVADSFGLTPMHMACMQGSLDVAVHLEKARAKMTGADKEGRTPLDAAQVNEHYHVVNFIRGQEIANMKELEKFSKALIEFKKRMDLEKLQEFRGEGGDVRKQLIQELQQMKAEVNALCSALGKGPVMEESNYASIATETQQQYASRR